MKIQKDQLGFLPLRSLCSLWLNPTTPLSLLADRKPLRRFDAEADRLAFASEIAAPADLYRCDLLYVHRHGRLVKGVELAEEKQALLAPRRA